MITAYLKQHKEPDKEFKNILEINLDNRVGIYLWDDDHLIFDKNLSVCH